MFRPLFFALWMAASFSTFAWGAEEVDVDAVTEEGPAGAVPPPPRRYSVGIGLLAHNMGKYATQDSGATSFFSSFFPQVSFKARYPLRENWGFSPILAVTPFGHRSADEGERTTIIHFSGRGYYDLGGVDLQLGVGLLNLIVRGTGGYIELGNGDGKSTFGIPSDSSMSNLFYWEAGVSARFPFGLSWENSLIVTGLLSSRRAFSFVTQLSYGVF